MLKNWTTLTICLAVSACANCSPPPCHAWTDSELAQLRSEDVALPQDATLHALIKNYEQICAE